jgi:tetratricopeptide (TPR) repeat protein
MRTVVVALLLLLVARVAVAAPGDELLQRGLRSYAVGRYDEAIDAFQRGYELSARADFLYALGQAQRMKGDCRAAIASYRAYLRTAPSERAAVPARQNIDRCEHELANAPPPTPPPAPVEPATPPAPTIVVVTPKPRVRDDRAAAILAGLGGAALVSGAVLWGVGESGARSLADATTYDQFAAHGHEAATFDGERIGGIVAVAVGGALVTVAVARWAWLARHLSAASQTPQ